MEPREVDQLQAVVEDAKAAAEPGPGLTFRPEIWLAYPCPGGCGKTMQAHRGAAKVHGDPVARIAQGRPDRLDFCEDCAPPPPRPARPVLDRAEALAAAGCPPKYRVPFVEPATWPADPRRPGFDLGAWQGDPWCVVIRGVVEAGKTFLATELLWRLIEKGRQGLWIRASQMVQALYGTKDAERAALWHRFTTAEVLLVDEIGRGHDGGAWSTIGDLFSVRFDEELPTITTTNRRLSAATRDEKGRTAPGEKLGIADEDAGLYRRLREGIAIGLMERWTPPAGKTTEVQP